MLENEKIYIIDSLTSATNLRFLVEDALSMAKKDALVNKSLTF